MRLQLTPVAAGGKPPAADFFWGARVREGPSGAAAEGLLGPWKGRRLSRSETTWWSVERQGLERFRAGIERNRDTLNRGATTGGGNGPEFHD